VDYIIFANFLQGKFLIKLKVYIFRAKSGVSVYFFFLNTTLSLASCCRFLNYYSFLLNFHSDSFTISLSPTKVYIFYAKSRFSVYFMSITTSLHFVSCHYFLHYNYFLLNYHSGSFTTPLSPTKVYIFHAKSRFSVYFAFPLP